MQTAYLSIHSEMGWGEVLGSISLAGESDSIQLLLSAGHTYVFDVQASMGSKLNPNIAEIIDPFGNVIDGISNADYGLGNHAHLNFTPTSTGVYRITAQGEDGTTGDYALSALDLSVVPLTDDVLLICNTPYNGRLIQAFETQKLVMDLLAGQLYTFVLAKVTTGNSLDYPYLKGIYDNTGKVLVGSSVHADIHGNAVATVTPVISGRYYALVGDNFDDTGGFSFTTSRDAATDLAANSTTIGQLAVGGYVCETIEVAHDQDWFAVHLTAGMQYQIDLMGVATAHGSLSDPYIVGVYCENETLLSNSSNDDASDGYNSRVILDIATSGMYYISAGAYRSNTGSYTLQVTSVGETDIPVNCTSISSVDLVASVQSAIDAPLTRSGVVGMPIIFSEVALPASAATLGSVVVNDRVVSAIETAHDQDWFAVRLTAGTQYQIDLMGSSTFDGSLSDPYIIGVYDAHSVLLANSSNDDAVDGYNARVTLDITTSSMYYISAGAYLSNTGSYTLQVTSVGASDLIPANMSTSAIINPGDRVSSVIDMAEDQDWFSMALIAGHHYSISQAGLSSHSGTLSDPYLRGIYDANSRYIEGTDDDDRGYGNDALVSFTPTTTGIYYLSAGAYAGATGTYLLSLVDNTSDTNRAPVVVDGTGTWTVMVYVAADNSLESYALSDVNEMEAAILPSTVNVVALIDRTPGYSSADGDWVDTRFGLISHDTNMNHIASSLTSWGERNMGSASTLTDFINASKAAAPADHYALVVWNHGGGISGASWDDTSYGDNLSLNEISQAILASNVTHFDMVGFDACLQGVFDQVYALRLQSSYQVVSQNTEPGDGWDYTNWLSVFNQGYTPTPLQVATEAVNSYASFYQARGNNSITLSAIDSSQVAGLASAWSAFAQSVNLVGDSAITSLEIARASTLTYYSHYVDLHGLMTEFIQGNPEGSLALSAQNVLMALNQAVVINGGNSSAHGLTMYLPANANSDYLNATNYPATTLSGVSDLYQAMWGLI
jgi:hypothetical protein